MDRHHALCRLRLGQRSTWRGDCDGQGRIVADFEFNHSLEGWKSFGEKTASFANLAVAIETSQGTVVDQFLQRGFTVYPVRPVAAQSYRERKAPSGTKTDRLDALGLADALRVDGHGWRVLQPTDPMTEQLRLLCRDEVTLIEQRTALVNQLQQALLEYYPAALEAFDDWTNDFTWEFVIAFPTPQLLVKAGSDPDRYGTHQVLQAFAGTAPVSYQSGKLNKVRIRWACDKFLRHTVHLWANCFWNASAWGRAYYQQKRDTGMSHACALRCLGQRLLKILFRMLKDKKPYDAELHARNQQKHGSWGLKLVAEPSEKNVNNFYEKVLYKTENNSAFVALSFV